MKRVYLLTLIIFIASIFIVGNLALAIQGSEEEMVKCAYDGMEMPESSMKAKMKYQDNMYYFCTKEEKDKFAEDPERYLKNERDSESQYEKGEEMHHDTEEIQEGHGDSSYGSQGHEGHGSSSHGSHGSQSDKGDGSDSSGHGGMGCMH